jgi:hypothetical protein
MNHTPTHINGKLATTKPRPRPPIRRTPMHQSVNPDAAMHIPSKCPKHECHNPLLQNASLMNRSNAPVNAASTCARTASKCPGSGWLGNEGSLFVRTGNDRMSVGRIDWHWRCTRTLAFLGRQVRNEQHFLPQFLTNPELHRRTLLQELGLCKREFILELPVLAQIEPLPEVSRVVHALARARDVRSGEDRLGPVVMDTAIVAYPEMEIPRWSVSM